MVKGETERVCSPVQFFVMSAPGRFRRFAAFLTAFGCGEVTAVHDADGILCSNVPEPDPAREEERSSDTGSQSQTEFCDVISTLLLHRERDCLNQNGTFPASGSLIDRSF